MVHSYQGNQKPPKNFTISILTSEEDIASQTILEQLVSLYPFVPIIQDPLLKHKEISKLFLWNKTPHLNFQIVSFNQSMLYVDEFPYHSHIPGDYLIFASRHQSQSNQHGLLCHTPGNFNADHSAGGKPFRIPMGSGILTHLLYMGLRNKTQSTHFSVPVDHEVSHHGPTEMVKPCAFIEQGSIEEHWKNSRGASIIAETIIETGIQLYNINSSSADQNVQIKTIIGFGGTHYMPSFQKLIPLGYGFAHTVPKYKINTLSSNLIEMIIKRTAEPIYAWVLDWKGLKSAQKNHLLEILEPTNIPVKKAHRIRHQQDVEN